MPSIFISYRRSDSSGHAGRLFDRLRQWYKSEDIFYDADSVEIGDNFPTVIEKALQSVKVVLVIIGPNCVKNLNERAKTSQIDFMRKEIALTIQRISAGEDITLIPLLMDNTNFPKADDLSVELVRDIGKLLDYQALSFYHTNIDWDHAFSQLLKQISKVSGVPQQCLQSPIQYNNFVQLDNLYSYSTYSSSKIHELKDKFDAISCQLLNWPQKIVNQWIDRPELDELLGSTLHGDITTTVVLGAPGEGKSALLARFGTIIKNENIILLCIKADQIQHDIVTIADLSKWLGLEELVTDVLRNLAKEIRVVVVIDQLDALSDLMDQYSERLNTLLNFIYSVCNVQNLSLILSCREFEFRNDIRLKTIDAKTILLKRLTWNQVLPLIKDKYLNTNNWSNEIRDVLCTPQYLLLFLENISIDVSNLDFTNYQGLLDQIITTRIINIHGLKTLKLAENIALTMANKEELWVSISLFERQYPKELNNLFETKLLVSSDDGLRLAFRHQTFFDHLRARIFVHDNQSLSDFVLIEKQSSLFVRPIMFSTLNYLRANDKNKYHLEFFCLWNNCELRLHLRYLLITFLGQVNNPDGKEFHCLRSAINNYELRNKAMDSIASNESWFNLIKKYLPFMMEDTHDNISSITNLLTHAILFEPEYVVNLINKQWIAKKSNLRSAAIVLSKLKTWNENSLNIVTTLVEIGIDDVYLIKNLVTSISNYKPDSTPRVILRYLESKISAVNVQQYENFTNNPDWHDLNEVALKSPIKFVQHLWPFLEKLFEPLVYQQSSHKIKYRDVGCSLPSNELDDSYSSPLLLAIEQSTVKFAKTEPNLFIDFVNSKKSTDIQFLHYLLSIGLERIVNYHPISILKYLTEDSRRLIIGNIYDPHLQSKALIAAIVPKLNCSDRKILETAIVNSNFYRINFDDQSARIRYELQKSTRQHKLHLLKSFPPGQLSKKGQSYLDELKRAFPHAIIQQASPPISGFVDSPMSSDEMEQATDCEIVGLFAQLTDDTNWEHPNINRLLNDHVGGSIEASRSFADFAKKNPERSLKIIRNFESGKSERPAAMALNELGDSEVDAVILIDCINDLEKQGFNSEEFREYTGQCLQKVARRTKGLDKSTCDLIKRWIKDTTIDNSDNTVNSLDVVDKSGFNFQHESILWGGSNSFVIPPGNYHLLEALRLGLLLRNPPDILEWLSVLEEHLNRCEYLEVWIALLPHLPRVFEADKTRAVNLVKRLFRSYPKILHSKLGAEFVAKIEHQLPSELMNRIMKDWISGDWEFGPIVAGEITALKLCRNPNDPTIVEQIQYYLGKNTYSPLIAEKLCIGIVFTLIQVWQTPALRALSNNYLIQIISIANKSISSALNSIFTKFDSFPADDYTHQLLKSMVEYPLVFHCRNSYHIVKILKNLLKEGWYPKFIYQLTSLLIQEFDSSLKDISTSVSIVSGDMIDIALTLHRMTDEKIEGMELFESLLEIEPHQLIERLQTIDRPVFHSK